MAVSGGEAKQNANKAEGKKAMHFAEDIEAAAFTITENIVVVPS